MIDLATIKSIRDVVTEEATHPCSYPGGCNHPALKVFEEVNDNTREPVYSCGCHMSGAYFAAYLALKTLSPNQEIKQACKVLHRNIEYLLHAEEENATSQKERQSIVMRQMVLLIIEGGLVSPQELSEVLDEIARQWQVRKVKDDLASLFEDYLNHNTNNRKFSVHKLDD